MNFWPLWPLDDPWGHIKYKFYSYPPHAWLWPSLIKIRLSVWKKKPIARKKERKKKEERKKKRQDPSKLGDAA